MTEKGYVGIVLETARKDNVIAALLGCNMSMALRQSKTTEEGSGDVRWKVVGECYLQGVMDGEAMDWRLEPQDIALR